MTERKCGDLEMHWWSEHISETTCICGQVPQEIFWSAMCTCGVDQLRLGSNAAHIHSPECAYVKWAELRNKWIDEHPEVDPPVKRVEVRTSVYYKDWYNGSIK